MPNTNQDIDVTENYGRSKRASMLYSAGLVVLGLAAAKNPAINVSWIGIEIPLNMARSLTWVAAIYYTAIFGLEWRVARIVNSKAMANETGGGVNARLKELSDRFQYYSERIGETSDGYIRAAEGVTGNIEQFRQAVSEQESKRSNYQPPNMASTQRASSETLFALPIVEQIDKAVADRLAPFPSMLKTDIEIVRTAADTNLAVYKDIASALAALVENFGTLSDRFNTEQKIMFYLLDLIAVLLLFVGGSAVGLKAIWTLIH